MGVYVQVDQICAYALFVCYQLLLHIEDGHVVDQIFIAGHGLYLFQLCFLKSVQCADAVLEKQDEQDDGDACTYKEVAVLFPEGARFVDEIRVGRT